MWQEEGGNGKEAPGQEGGPSLTSGKQFIAVQKGQQGQVWEWMSE